MSIGAAAAELVALKEYWVILAYVREISSHKALAAPRALSEPPAGAGLRVDEHYGTPRARTCPAFYPRARLSIVDEP